MSKTRSRGKMSTIEKCVDRSTRLDLHVANAPKREPGYVRPQHVAGLQHVPDHALAHAIQFVSLHAREYPVTHDAVWEERNRPRGVVQARPRQVLKGGVRELALCTGPLRLTASPFSIGVRSLRSLGRRAPL